MQKCKSIFMIFSELICFNEDNLHLLYNFLAVYSLKSKVEK